MDRGRTDVPDEMDIRKVTLYGNRVHVCLESGRKDKDEMTGTHKQQTGIRGKRN